jgi:hypothetical protein
MGYSANAAEIRKTVRWEPRETAPAHCFISSTQESDGIGAQCHARLSILLFASYAGIKYAHTPFLSVRSVPNQDWLNDNAGAWERFFDLGRDKVPATAAKTSRTAILDPLKIHQHRFESDTMHIVRHCHLFGDFFPERYPALISETNAGPVGAYCVRRPRLRGDPLNIVLHLRRGDIVHRDGSVRLAHRYTNTSDALRTLTEIRLVTEGLGIPSNLHIVTDGDPSGYEAWEGIGAKFSIGGSPFQAFCQLLAADILVIAKSSFSYVAGLFSPGIKVYEPFFHQPPPGWIVTPNPGAAWNVFTKHLTDAINEWESAR